MAYVLALCAGLVLYGLIRAQAIFQQWHLSSAQAQRKFITECAIAASLRKAQQSEDMP